MVYKNRLYELRGSMSQNDFAKLIGMSQQNYGNYENGKQALRSDLIERICSEFGCSAEWLLGMSDTKSRDMRPIDCYARNVGRIVAGTPLEAIEADGEPVWVDPEVKRMHPNAFFLTVSGDSMDMRFADGCNVLVDPDQRDIVNGKVYAVLVNGCDATLKQVFLAGNTIVLHPQSTNPSHRDISIDASSPDAPYFAVVGRVVWASWSDDRI